MGGCGDGEKGKKIAVEDVRENFEGDGVGWLMCLIGFGLDLQAILCTV